MTSASDPYRRFQRRMAFQAGACWLLVLLAAGWAWRVPAPTAPVLATARPARVEGQATTPAINPAAWNINLWRPFLDEAAPVATAGAPTAFKLFSIMQQGDGFTAAISAGDGALVYVKAGDSGPGFSVVRVEAGAVVLRINGQEQRLGLGQ